jgi:hypothetical protein
MSGEKSFSSIEELLAVAKKQRKPRVASNAPKAAEKAAKSSFGSIEDLMADAEVRRQKERKNLKTFASTMKAQANSDAAPRPAATAQPADDDLMDELDHAIDAVQTARKAVPDDSGAAGLIAVNLLLKKQSMSRDAAQGLIARAVKYLDK